jgi:hypothetical protein
MNTSLLERTIETNEASPVTISISTGDATEAVAEQHSEHSERVLKLRADSVVAQVQSTVALSAGMETLKDDHEQLEKFLAALCSAKLLTNAEIQKRGASAQSKWKKIGRYASVFLDDRILRVLTPGYSVMYELTLLIEDMGSASGTVDRLVELFDELDGPMTREWIKKRRDALKPPKQVATVEAPSIAAGDDSQVAQTERVSRPIGPKTFFDSGLSKPTEGSTARQPVSYLISAGDDGPIQQREEVPSDGQEAEPETRNSAPSASKAPELDGQVTAALLVVEKRDAERLVLASQGPEWQRATDQLAEDAVIFVFTTMQVLLTIGPAIQTFGWDRCDNVYLLSEPDGRDAAKCNVLAVFERGDGVDVEGVPSWEPSDAPHLIAEQFLQGVPGRRLHLLADTALLGWEALTVDPV